MTNPAISPEKIVGIAIKCIAVSSIAAMAFVLFPRSEAVRAAAGGFGIMSAFFGSGVAGWFAFRARDRKLILACIASALPLTFWVWTLHNALHAGGPVR